MNLKSLLSHKKVLSLDFGSYQIKGIIGKVTKEGIVVDKHFTFLTPEGAYQDGQIMDKSLLHYIIYNELKKYNIKTKNVYLTINSTEIIVREVIIPKVKPEEIIKVLNFQIPEYIPMNPDDYIVQSKLIGSIYENDIEKLSILLIGIPKEMVESHFKLMKDLNLNPLVLDYQPNSIGKLLKFTNYINIDYSTHDITFAVIDIGYKTTKVSIIKNGIIHVSRVIEIAGEYIDQCILNSLEYSQNELRQIKENLDSINQFDQSNSKDISIRNIIINVLNLLNERIEIVFRYYLTRQSGNQINVILLCGGNVNFNGLDNYYSNYFSIPSIRIDSIDKIVFDGKVYEYANSLGALIRRGGE